MKWEIRTEGCTSRAFSLSGIVGPATRVRYRPKGSRGRFHAFLVEGRPDLTQAELQELVDKMEAGE